MRIVFYCKEQAPANIDNYLGIGASGTVSALILAGHGLSLLGHEVIILNRSQSGLFQKTRHLQTSSPEEVVERIAEIGEVDVFIANGFASDIYQVHDIQARKRAAWIHNFVHQRPFENAVREGRLDYIICISHNQLGTWWRSPIFNRVAQVYNCIDVAAIDRVSANLKKEKKIMFIGAPRQSKGFHDALRIFVAFSKRNPDYQFYVAGSASLHGSASELSENGIFEKDYEQGHLKELLVDEKGNPRSDVVLLGKIPRDEVLAHLGTAAVALQNPCWDSEPEVHSISALEAQAMGVPVLSAFRGGQPEVILNGVTGILLKNRDVDAAVRALESITSNPELACNMAERAKKHIRENFQIATIATQWNGIMQDVVGDVRFNRNILKAIRSKIRHKLRW